MMPTMRSRDATFGSDWNAGRWPERAIPPSPTRTPRYTRASGELGMEFRLTLVRENEKDEHGVQRPDDDPAVGSRPVRHRRQGQQHEPDLLGDQRAALHDPTLALRPRSAQRRGDIASCQRPGQTGRAREQPTLAAHVVAVTAR